MDPLEELLLESKRRADAHLHVAAKLKRSHYYLGIPLVFATAAIGTDYLRQGDMVTTYVSPIIALVAVVLAALQTFLNHQERSEAHKNAGSSWQNLKLEIMSAIKLSSDETILMSKADALRQASPSVPNKIWEISVRKYNQHDNS